MCLPAEKIIRDLRVKCRQNVDHARIDAECDYSAGIFVRLG